MSYVIAGYSIALSVLAIYAGSLIVRLRRAQGKRTQRGAP